MQCPKCSDSRHGVRSSNSQLPDQVVRQRVCQACGWMWFTVEAEVNRFAIGWSTASSKPVLREAVTLELGFVPELPRGRPPRGHITNCYSPGGVPHVGGDN
jgi:hypothetical protein